MWMKRPTPAEAEASARFRVASMQPAWNSRQGPQSPTFAAEW
jgi:hypothetical protein